MYFSHGRVLYLILALFLSSVVSCSKVSKGNYDKLKVGMTYEQVESILGSPDNSMEGLGIKACLWGSDRKHIKVAFFGIEAVAFSKKGLQ